MSQDNSTQIFPCCLTKLEAKFHRLGDDPYYGEAWDEPVIGYQFRMWVMEEGEMVTPLNTNVVCKVEKISTERCNVAYKILTMSSSVYLIEDLSTIKE